MYMYCMYVCVVCVQCYIPVTRLSPSGSLQSLLTFGVNVFPSNDSHKYVDLPDKVSFTFCVCFIHFDIHGCVVYVHSVYIVRVLYVYVHKHMNVLLCVVFVDVCCYVTCIKLMLQCN